MEEETKPSGEFIKRKKSTLAYDLENEESEDDIFKLPEEEKQLIRDKIEENREFIIKSLQASPIAYGGGVYISVIVSLIFILIGSMISQVEILSGVGTIIRNEFENTYWDSTETKVFQNLTSLKELDIYVRHVALPNCYSKLGNYNYLAGVRITLKISKIIKQPVSDYLSIKPYVKASPDIPPYLSNSDLYSERLGIWNYEKGYGNNGGYVIYLFQNSSLEDSLKIWRESSPVWLSEYSFSSLIIEYIIHNSNYGATVYYNQIFHSDSSGKLIINSQIIGSFYQNFENWEGNSLTILILVILYCLGFSLQFISILKMIFRVIKTFVLKRKVELEWYEYLEIISAVLSIFCVFFFLIFILGERGKYSLPIKDKTTFIGLANYCVGFKKLIQIISLTSLLIAIRVIVVLRLKFPSFGIIFDTIIKAQTDILNFMSITFLLIVGFVFMGNLLFGPTGSDYKNLELSFSTLLNLYLGQISNYDEILQSNSILSPLFLILYVTMFFLVLIKMFLAIMVSTYSLLKSKGQLLLDAKAGILAEESKEWIQALLNLILFKTHSAEKDALEYEKLLEKNRETMSPSELAKLDEEIKLHETLILASTKVDIIKILKTNFGKVISLWGPSVMTQEQNIQKVYDILYKILEEKKLEQHKKVKLSKRVDYNFNLIVQLIIYLFYLLVFLFMVSVRLGNEYAYKINGVSIDGLSNTEFNGLTLATIRNQTDFFYYFKYVVGPLMSQTYISDHNYFISSQTARITGENYVPEANLNAFSYNITQYYIPATQSQLSNSDARGPVTKLKSHYYPPGTKETFKQKGGYLYMLQLNTDSLKTFELLELDDLLGKLGAYLTMEWITYNPNLNVFSYSYIRFNHLLSGEIQSKIYSNSIPLDILSSDNALGTVLEVLFLLFTIYYILLELNEWRGYWKVIRSKEELKKEGEEALKRVVYKLTGKSGKPDGKGCRVVLTNAMLSLKSIIIWIIKFIINVYETTKMYFTSDFFNVLDVTSIILSLMNVQIAFELYTNDFVQNYEINDASNEKYNTFGEFSIIDDQLVLYKTLVGFNSLIIFTRVIQFYRFSANLSIFTNILNSAKLDLFFFFIMYAIVLFAFTIMGYLLLGSNLLAYSKLSSSLMSCYFMLDGSFDSSAIYQSDATYGVIFNVGFIIIFSFVLNFMFVAIIVSHYRMVYQEVEAQKDEDGIFKKIYRIIAAKCRGEKYLRKKKPNQNNTKNQENLEEKDLKVEVEQDSVSFNFEEKNSDLGTHITWLKVLEIMLLEKTDEKIRLFGMKNHSSKKDNFNAIYDPSSMGEIPFINKEIWQSEPIPGRIKIWKALAEISRKNTFLSIEKAYIEGEELPEQVKLDEHMQILWDANTDEEKLELWMGKDHFNDAERISVWNSTQFLPETIALIGQENFENWECLKIKEKIKGLSNLVERYKGFINTLKKSKNKLETVKNFLKIIHDFKVILWISLTYNDQWTDCLYINQSDSLEADIYGLLNIVMRKDNIFAIELMDIGLEELLDKSIYEWVETKAVYMSEKHLKIQLDDKIASMRSEIKALNEYKVYTKKELAKFSDIRSNLRHKISKRLV